MTQRCIAGGIWSKTISPKSRSSAPSPRDTTRQSKASAPTSTLPLRSSPQGKCQQTLVLQPGFCVTSAGRQSSMVTQTDVQAWADGLDGVVDRIAPRFGRPEPWRGARAYLRGWRPPVERKNDWQVAEAVGDATPDGVQDFLSRVQWDADAVRDDLQAYVV